jgi:hypothetical protein
MRILVLNRWDDEFAEYDRYIDHDEHQVAYLTCPKGLSRLPCDRAAAVETVEHFTNTDAIDAAARVLARTLGSIDRLFALSEFDILHGARLRDLLDIPGMRSARAVLYRDKVAMKSAIRAAGLKTPAYTDSSQSRDLARLAAEVGFPLILKPRTGAASEGVLRVDSARSLAAACETVLSGDIAYECEEYIPGQIYHIDGIIAGGYVSFIQPSRYLNTCLDFRHGLPLGSVLLDSDDPRRERICSFTGKCLAALSLDNSAFHLELIERADGTLYFLEMGARVGGGEIPFLIDDLFNVDLVREWINAELYLSSNGPVPAARSNGGFLMIPEPKGVPCEVLSATSLLGIVPCIYWEAVPAIGDILDGTGGYSHIGGRFRFRGSSACQVEASIRGAMNVFALGVRPIVAKAAA